MPEILIYSVALPVAAILLFKIACIRVYSFAMSLWVDGKASDWVLIMNSGKMVKAGVGLRCFKSPFDQVATFPAKVYKVNFETQQVTNEMQGVKVSGMLVWTVNRVGEGPFNAYKNLGDISSGNPRTANDSLTNRKLLRDAIHKEMFEVVKGWGVWLETIEITGV